MAAMASFAISMLPRGEELMGSEQWLGYESLFASVDVLHCALLLILLVGILLASFTEDASRDSLRVSWIATQLLPGPRSQPDLGAGSLTDVQQMMNELAEQKAAQRLKKILQPFVEAVEEGRLVALLCEKLGRLRETVAFYCRVLHVRRFAEGTRHLFYMAQKIKLGMDVKPGESEVLTYVDSKMALKEDNRWPFMVEVADVKSDRVTCAGRKKAYPMSSYSYLDFIREPQVQEAAIAAAREWSTGSHGARMLGGNSSILLSLEKTVANFYGREGALLCATGFLATMSAVAAVSKKGDLIVADRRAHASLRTGMTISGARFVFFKHNNYSHLKALLHKERRKARNCWIIIESVYSMEGDIADLPVVRGLADAFNAKIICDEAHGLGVLGRTGRGLEEYYSMPGACDVICGTFSKSIAGVGGFIACDRPLVDFLDFHAPGSVFSASLTAYSAGGAIKAFELMTGEQQWRIRKAQENARYLRTLIETGDGNWPADYPEEFKYETEGMDCTTVIPVVFPNSPQRLFRITMSLLDRGFFCAAAAFPACPLLRPRIRVTATAAYTKELMHAFVKALVKTTVENLPDDEEIKRQSQQTQQQTAAARRQ